MGKITMAETRKAGTRRAKGGLLLLLLMLLSGCGASQEAAKPAETEAAETAAVAIDYSKETSWAYC